MIYCTYYRVDNADGPNNTTATIVLKMHSKFHQGAEEKGKRNKQARAIKL